MTDHLTFDWCVYFSRSIRFSRALVCGRIKNLWISCRRYFKVPLPILLATSPLACRLRRQNFLFRVRLQYRQLRRLLQTHLGTYVNLWMMWRVALGTQIVEQRINSEVKIIVLIKPMNNPLGVSPSKGKQGPHEARLLTSVGIEPTTSGLVLPLLCRLSYKVAQRKSGTI